MSFDPKKIAADLKWLQHHPHFDEKPASVVEFLGADYLNIEKGIRPGVRQELVELFGSEVNGERIARVRWGMFTGAIGIGKTTMASIILPYMCHWCLCLKSPQDYYDLLPGSRIAFMMMSTSEDQAKETVFGDVKARIEHSKWFQENYPYDPKFTNQIRFSKDIWVLPGNSAETTFEGYNILGGILDEADSHKVTRDKDYAEQGWDTINSRIDSRFQDRGFLLTVGQMKKANGFAAKKYKELKADADNAHTVRMSIWESRGWDKYLKADGTRDSFWYDSKRKEIVPDSVVGLMGVTSNLIEVPNLYRKNFENNPEKALRDLAGIPPTAGEAFISLTHKIDDALSRWQEHHPDLGSPVTPDVVRPIIEDWLVATDSLKRVLTLDIATAGGGDAAGIAMAHISHLVEDDATDEEKPYIVVDALLRVAVPPGQEILISDLRRYIYQLKDERGFRIGTVSMDGHQSTDTRQQLRKRKIKAQYLSMDKSKLPYYDLRDAIYEDRIEWPPYYTYVKKGDTDKVLILHKELMELEEGDRKIDHPANGSKDLADAVAGVVHTLMGDRTYRRGVTSKSRAHLSDEDIEAELEQRTPDGYSVGGHFVPGLGSMGLSAPIPPSFGDSDLSSPIPPGLLPRRD